MRMICAEDRDYGLGKSHDEFGYLAMILVVDYHPSFRGSLEIDSR